MSLAKSHTITSPLTGIGLFSKRDGASLVTSGCKHIHSSILGSRDSLVALTLKSITDRSPAVYPWEISENTKEIFLSSSKERKKVIEQVLSEFKLKINSSIGDKIWTCLEEMLTNSIFHAYHDSQGNEKYHRKAVVELKPHEKISIKFHNNSKGFFVSVQDFGQGLSFEKIQANFKRCYESSGLSQIEAKDSGAGLGLYVVFELSTHLKIVTHPDLGTLTSCWFATHSNFDPDYFSFNYFEGAKKP